MRPSAEHSLPSLGRLTRRETAWQRLAAHPAFVSAILAVATIAVFWPVTHAEFLNYDDPQYVTANAHVLTGLKWENVTWAFGAFYASNWHPLTWLSHMLDTELFGRGAGGPHGVNLALHVANSLLLFGLLRRMTGAHWRSAWVAGLFALHPLHVESVAWVSERKDVLSAFFFMLTLWAYVRYAEKSGASNQRPVVSNQSSSTSTTGKPLWTTGYQPLITEHRLLCYLLSLFFFACGLMSKPMLVTLPLVMLLLDYWPLQRFWPSTFNSKLSTFWGLAWEKAPFLVLAAASSLVTVLAQSKALQPLTSFPMADRLGNALVSYARYLGKAFWPAGLALPYPLPEPWLAIEVAMAALLVISLCLGAIWAGRQLPFLVSGWFWFWGTLIPVIGVVQVGGQAMADRYTYLPLIGLFIVLAWGAGQAQVRWNLAPRMMGIAAALSLVVCGVLSWRQASYWHDDQRLFRHAVEVARANVVALDNIGVSLFACGRLEEAMDYYLRSLRIQPKNVQTLNNVGAVLAAQGNAEAADWYRRALAIDPANAEALYNLGTAMAARERFTEAISYFEAALKADPDHIEAHNNLGNALVKVGRLEEAATHYKLALQLRPDIAQTHKNFAALLLTQSKLDQAVIEYRFALGQDPKDAATHYGLGLALALQGKWEAAIQEYTNTLRLTPNNPEAEYNLGYALRSQGRLEEAVIHLQQALRLKPEFALAHYNLGCALALEGRRAEAVTHMREALRLQPDYMEAKEKLGELAP